MKILISFGVEKSLMYEFFLYSEPDGSLDFSALRTESYLLANPILDWGRFILKMGYFTCNCKTAVQ